MSLGCPTLSPLMNTYMHATETQTESFTGYTNHQKVNEIPDMSSRDRTTSRPLVKFTYTPVKQKEGKC